MFGIVSKIPKGNTFIELEGVGFVDYVGFSAFLRIQGEFARCPAIILRVQKRKMNKRPKWFDGGDSEFLRCVWGARNYRCGYKFRDLPAQLPEIPVPPAVQFCKQYFRGGRGGSPNPRGVRTSTRTLPNDDCPFGWK